LAWEHRIKGMSERLIAEEIEKAGLGRITQQGVSLMLIRIEARTLEQMTERIGGEKARQTHALWHIYHEAMQAWERSKAANKSITKRVDSRSGKATDDGSASGATGSEQITTHISDQDGDPRFLDQARAALADARKIWGFEAPQRHQHGGDPDGPPVSLQVVEVLVTSRAEAAALAAIEANGESKSTNGVAYLPSPESLS